MIWANGEKYVGQWKDGQQHGTGSFTDKEHGTRKGQWKNGKNVKWL